MAFISPPRKIPLFLRFGLWIAQRITGQNLLPARLLAWYPKAALSSGLLEALIAHHDGSIDERMLKLVRMQVSFSAGCPFCMDMNSAGWQKLLTPDELAVLQSRRTASDTPSLSGREQLAIQYARLVSATPLHFPSDFIAQLRANFSEREIVVLATTAAQVNYWARLIQALGCPPEGYGEAGLYLPVSKER